jgi:hypothetical protein
MLNASPSLPHLKAFNFNTGDLMTPFQLQKSWAVHEKDLIIVLPRHHCSSAW